MVSLPKVIHDFVGEEFEKGWVGGHLRSGCHELRRLGLEDPFSRWLLHSEGELLFPQAPS